jgi:CysZ protein
VTQEQAVAVARAPGVTGVWRDFFSGVGFLLRGIGMYARNPRTMLLGLLPALISGVLLVGAFVAMIFFVDDVVRWATPFADNWSSGVRDTVRFVAMFGIAAVWLMLSVLAYAALTLVIGQPFYEAISKRVEDQLGGVPNSVDVSFWRSLPRSIVDSVRLLILTAVLGIFIFGTGLIPVVGEIVTPVLGAIVGGWVLALELSSVPFERRGMRFKQRRKMLRSRRAMSLGFGVATFLCFLIPLGAVLVMPAAVAGATLLSRKVVGLPDSRMQNGTYADIPGRG